MSVFSIPLDEMEVGIANHFCTSECLHVSKRETVTFEGKTEWAFFFFFEWNTIVTWNKDWRINYGYWNSQILENIFFTTHKESLTLQDKQLTGMRKAKPVARGHKQVILHGVWTHRTDGCFCISLTSTTSWGPSSGARSPAGGVNVSCFALHAAGTVWEPVHAAALLLKTACFTPGAGNGEAAPTLISSAALGTKTPLVVSPDFECLPAVSEDDLPVLGKRVWGL